MKQKKVLSTSHDESSQSWSSLPNVRVFLTNHIVFSSDLMIIEMQFLWMLHERFNRLLLSVGQLVHWGGELILRLFEYSLWQLVFKNKRLSLTWHAGKYFFKLIKRPSRRIRHEMYYIKTKLNWRCLIRAIFPQQVSQWCCETWCNI